MKLDNHGWGMREMIIYMCILILFLLFASYSVNTLYENLAKSTNDTDSATENVPPVDLQYYRNLEYKLNNATFNYLFNADISSINNLNNKISLGLLEEHEFIEILYDQFGTNTCDGYSSFYRNEKGSFVVNSFISCNNYETEGY